MRGGANASVSFFKLAVMPITGAQSAFRLATFDRCITPLPLRPECSRGGRFWLSFSALCLVGVVIAVGENSLCSSRDSFSGLAAQIQSLQMGRDRSVTRGAAHRAEEAKWRIEGGSRSATPST